MILNYVDNIKNDHRMIVTRFQSSNWNKLQTHYVMLLWLVLTLSGSDSDGLVIESRHLFTMSIFVAVVVVVVVVNDLTFTANECNWISRTSNTNSIVQTLNAHHVFYLCNDGHLLFNRIKSAHHMITSSSLLLPFNTEPQKHKACWLFV